MRRVEGMVVLVAAVVYLGQDCMPSCKSTPSQQARRHLPTFGVHVAFVDSEIVPLR